jgi:1-acyl-sn-glycerol-3-phosphate acyltransferase
MPAELTTPPEPFRRRLAISVYNALYWPYLLTTCAALFGPAIGLYALSRPWDKRRKLLQAYTSLWGAHYLAWAPFAGVEVSGRSNIPRGGPCVFVSNHLSMVDILAVFALREPFLWVSKIENFYVPFLGWNMFLNGYVPLRRGHLPSILRMVRTCNARLREGHSLFVFPEGTRSSDGQLKPFHRGAFWLATYNRVPIVPVVIEGTDRVLAKRSLRIVPQKVSVHTLPAIHPSIVDYDSRRLCALVHDQMAKELERMRGGVKAASEPVPAALAAE